jgi:hypothetical protein
MDGEFVPERDRESAGGTVLVAMLDVRHAQPLIAVAVPTGRLDAELNAAWRSPAAPSRIDQKNVFGFASCALETGEMESARATTVKMGLRPTCI